MRKLAGQPITIAYAQLAPLARSNLWSLCIHHCVSLSCLQQPHTISVFSFLSIKFKPQRTIVPCGEAATENRPPSAAITIPESTYACDRNYWTAITTPSTHVTKARINPSIFPPRQPSHRDAHTLAGANFYYCNHHAIIDSEMTDEHAPITKRGRPPKGVRPMSDSERKRAQRTRDSPAAIEAIGDEQNASLRALMALLRRAETSGPGRRSAGRAWAEIGRRHGFVTITK